MSVTNVSGVANLLIGNGSGKDGGGKVGAMSRRSLSRHEQRLQQSLDRFVCFTASLEDEALLAVVDALTALSRNALAISHPRFSPPLSSPSESGSNLRS